MFRERQTLQEVGALALSEVRALEDVPARLAPWEAEPYRLWSLWDMVRFYNAAFSAALGEFNRALGAMGMAGEIAIPTFAESLAGLADEVTRAELPLSHGTRDHFRLLKMHLDAQPDRDAVTVLVVLSRSLLNGLIGDLSQHVFLRVPPSRKALFQQKEPLFGADVYFKFPGASDDIAAAARCLALDQWVACVFHCMRVLEFGLEPMAKRFNVSFEKATWHAVLRDIESGITALRAQKNRTAQEDDEITNYSEAAIQFRHFKDAWRNHVSHNRGSYDEPKAQNVYDSVESFMRKMAEIV